MTRIEYEMLQERLSEKLHKCPTDSYGSKLTSKEKDGYELAIKSIKSMLSNIYHNQIGND